MAGFAFVYPAGYSDRFKAVPALLALIITVNNAVDIFRLASRRKGIAPDRLARPSLRTVIGVAMQSYFSPSGVCANRRIMRPGTSNDREVLRERHKDGCTGMTLIVSSRLS